MLTCRKTFILLLPVVKRACYSILGTIPGQLIQRAHIEIEATRIRLTAEIKAHKMRHTGVQTIPHPAFPGIGTKCGLRSLSSGSEAPLCPAAPPLPSSQLVLSRDPLGLGVEDSMDIEALLSSPVKHKSD